MTEYIYNGPMALIHYPVVVKGGGQVWTNDDGHSYARCFVDAHLDAFGEGERVTLRYGDNYVAATVLGTLVSGGGTQTASAVELRL